MAKQAYHTKEEWRKAAKAQGYSIESWGFCGSSDAHNINGEVVGTWFAPFDTHDNCAYGTLHIQ